MKLSVPILFSTLAILFAVAPALRAGEWPQILGPTRNANAVGERLADAWPEGGPKSLWQRDVGRGLAGAAVAQGRVVVFHRQGKEEIVEALDAATGKPLWKNGFPTQYVSTYSDDDGPRCVPVIHQGHVYLYGAQGRLACVSLATGKERWSRDANHEFKSPESYFGAGSTPLVEGDKLLVNIGGRDGAGLVAFSLADGRTIWKATDEGASYSSPVAATVDGVRHVIFITRLSALSIDPASGKVRFQFPFGQRGPTVNAANPLVLDGHVFLSASYGIGATLAKISADDARIVWQSDDVMSSQYTTCVEHGGYLYGIDGRQDIGVARLRCIEPMTGKVKWTEEGFGMATLLLADGKLVIVKADGGLALARPAPDGYHELAAAKPFDSTTRALPALADGRLYVRDTSTLKCLNLGRP